MDIKSKKTFVISVVVIVSFTVIWYFLSRYRADRDFNECLNAIMKIKTIDDLTTQKEEEFRQAYPNVLLPEHLYGGDCEDMSFGECSELRWKIIEEHCDPKTFSSAESGPGRDMYYSAKPKKLDCWICVTDYRTVPSGSRECKPTYECIFESTQP